MNTAKFAKIITVKTLSAVLILSLVLTVILYPPPIIAGNDLPVLPNAGLTPLNRFYFVDQWSETISSFFTFGPEAKIKLQLSLIAERIAEMRIVIENKGTESPEVEIIKNSIQQRLNLVAAIISKEQQKGKDVGNLQLIAQAGIDDTKRVLGDVLGENQQQLQEEILDDLTRISEANIGQEKQPIKNEQNDLSEKPEPDEQKQNKDSGEIGSRDGVDTSTRQLITSAFTITTSGGQATTTPSPTPTLTPSSVSAILSSTDLMTTAVVGDALTQIFIVCPRISGVNLNIIYGRENEVTEYNGILAGVTKTQNYSSCSHPDHGISLVPIHWLGFGNTYKYQLAFSDSAGNEIYREGIIRKITTAVAPDTTPPVFSVQDIAVTSDSATISYTFDDPLPGSNFIYYSKEPVPDNAGELFDRNTTGLYRINSKFQLDNSGVKLIGSITGLESNTVYHYRIRGNNETTTIDGKQNHLATLSADATFITKP